MVQITPIQQIAVIVRKLTHEPNKLKGSIYLEILKNKESKGGRNVLDSLVPNLGTISKQIVKFLSEHPKVLQQNLALASDLHHVQMLRPFLQRSPRRFIVSKRLKKILLGPGLPHGNRSSSGFRIRLRPERSPG
ncbi:hypothetical protein F2Q69_00059611 [Brassica cretica]|uniref:Uncharacterized protein n=1 Tax=Brassica cretica TaxID=69181 RepID=A0A8S9RDZ4_BRACR|nr:hypothetical protein F2Q69_00059611 [Brassica cretica]